MAAVLRPLRAFLFPVRRYWDPPHNNGPRLLLAVAGFCIVIWCLVIASCVYSAVYYRQEDSSRYFQYGFPPIHWDKLHDPSYDDRSTVLWLLLPVGVETVHLPIHITLYLKDKLHPGVALALSMCMMGGWLVFALFGIFADVGSKVRYPDIWQGLDYVRLAVEVTLVFIYFVYFVIAGLTLHKMRTDRRREKGGMIELVHHGLLNEDAPSVKKPRSQRG